MQVHPSPDHFYHGHPPSQSQSQSHSHSQSHSTSRSHSQSQSQSASVSGYSNGLGQSYKQEPHFASDNQHSSPNMYPYGQHPQQQQQHQQQQQQQQQHQHQQHHQQQHQQQHPQQHLQHPQHQPQQHQPQQHQPQQHQPQQPQQHHQHPGYPGMQSSIQPPRMPPPGQPGLLPPLHTGMSANTLPALPGAQSMPSMMPQHQQMYGAPQQSITPQAKPEPKAMSFSGIKGEYRYELRVEQQPQRARMCGFGDKDRRPITPPPCVRLIITHKDTGHEVDPDSIEGNFFILQVDLWDKDATREVNVVRASSSSPAVSISTATTTSYPPPQERTMLNQFGQPMSMMYAPQDGQAYYDPSQGMGYASSMYMPQYPQPVVPPPSNAMYTRNLIGSLTVNASLLHDTQDKPGYWFVLQDLSVRTEGWFRLKMNFIDLGDPTADAGLNRQKCPVLAWSYSDAFQVFSAKKFPGVIESTPLSKAFATQGIKIPIRKEGRPEKNDDEDEG